MMEKVARLYDAMQHVITISKEQGIPTDPGRDVLVEQRIAEVGQAKRIATSVNRKDL